MSVKPLSALFVLTPNPEHLFKRSVLNVVLLALLTDICVVLEEGLFRIHWCALEGWHAIAHNVNRNYTLIVDYETWRFCALNFECTRLYEVNVILGYDLSYFFILFQISVATAIDKLVGF